MSSRPHRRGSLKDVLKEQIAITQNEARLAMLSSQNEARFTKFSHHDVLKNMLEVQLANPQNENLFLLHKRVISIVDDIVFLRAERRKNEQNTPLLLRALYLLSAMLSVQKETVGPEMLLAHSALLDTIESEINDVFIH